MVTLSTIMTREQMLAFVWQTVALLGGAGVSCRRRGGICWKLFADRSIERHRAVLTRETERLKAELSKERTRTNGRFGRKNSYSKKNWKLPQNSSSFTGSLNHNIDIPI